MENMKDPAFKLFVILLQPAKCLDVKNEYIICFLGRKTYLEMGDPDLFQKISKYLTWVKKPRKGSGPEEDDLLSDTDEHNR